MPRRCGPEGRKSCSDVLSNGRRRPPVTNSGGARGAAGLPLRGEKCRRCGPASACCGQLAPTATDGHRRLRRDESAGTHGRALCAGDRQTGRPAVVFVPALGVPEDLMNVASECGKWTRSVLLDVLGPAGRVDLPTFATAVAEWLKVTADAPVVLAGHSTGAQAALHAAVQMPGAVRALVLMSPTFPPHLRQVPALLRATFRNVAHESLGVWRAVLPGCVRIGAVTLFRLLRSAQHDQPEATIADVRCPVLVVRGEQDPFCPEPWATRLSNTARRGQCVNVPGAHGFPHQHGTNTSALIAEFTERCT
ncbi:alpha/beta hydrolase [Actinosynnema sp. NPDC023587]|uniref:alpha/beta fold hydrolase n=1 Tax=Actinosynnema sp. NPDC023587 TaxID=3154695 RepID=UPI0033DF3018